MPAAPALAQYAHEEGFETYASAQINVPPYNEHDLHYRGAAQGWWWQTMGNTRSNPDVTIAIVEDLVHSGRKAMRIDVPRAALASKKFVKANLIHDIRAENSAFAFKRGQIVSVGAWFYIPKTWFCPMEGEGFRLIDLGTRGKKHNPELRLSMHGPHCGISVNRKMKPYIAGDELESRRPIVPGQWTKIEMRLKIGQLEPVEGRKGWRRFDPEAPAWLQVAVDDELVLACSCTTVLPEPDATINSVQLGITITSKPATLYVHDFWLREAGEPLPMS
jgi:hypothetical protein